MCIRDSYYSVVIIVGAGAIVANVVIACVVVAADTGIVCYSLEDKHVEQHATQNVQHKNITTRI